MVYYPYSTVLPLQYYPYSIVLPLQYYPYSIVLPFQSYPSSTTLTALPLQYYPYSTTLTALPFLPGVEVGYGSCIFVRIIVLRAGHALHHLRGCAVARSEEMRSSERIEEMRLFSPAPVPPSSAECSSAPARAVSSTAAASALCARHCVEAW